jgi:hypothetical protein
VSVITVSASMPAELARALHDQACKADRSFSAEMRVAIRAHLGQPAHTTIATDDHAKADGACTTG